MTDVRRHGHGAVDHRCDLALAVPLCQFYHHRALALGSHLAKSPQNTPMACSHLETCDAKGMAAYAHVGDFSVDAVVYVEAALSNAQAIVPLPTSPAHLMLPVPHAGGHAGEPARLACGLRPCIWCVPRPPVGLASARLGYALNCQSAPKRLPQSARKPLGAALARRLRALSSCNNSVGHASMSWRKCRHAPEKSLRSRQHDMEMR